MRSHDTNAKSLRDTSRSSRSPRLVWPHHLAILSRESSRLGISCDYWTRYPVRPVRHGDISTIWAYSEKSQRQTIWDYSRSENKKEESPRSCMGFYNKKINMPICPKCHFRDCVTTEKTHQCKNCFFVWKREEADNRIPTIDDFMKIFWKKK